MKVNILGLGNNRGRIWIWYVWGVINTLMKGIWRDVISTEAERVDQGRLEECRTQERECSSWSSRGSHLWSEWMWSNLCLWQDKCALSVNCGLKWEHKRWTSNTQYLNQGTVYVKRTSGIVSWNIDEVEINVRSDWLRKYERRVWIKRFITFLTTFVNIPTSCWGYESFWDIFYLKFLL